MHLEKFERYSVASWSAGSISARACDVGLELGTNFHGNCAGFYNESDRRLLRGDVADDDCSKLVNEIARPWIDVYVNGRVRRRDRITCAGGHKMLRKRGQKQPK